MITAELRAAFPKAIVVGEEAAHRDPSLLQAIGGAELAFIVDPIDGTRNFASGLPLFGVMAAATMRGEIVAQRDPRPDLRATSPMRVKGGGAWLESEDGKRTRLRVAPPVPVGGWRASSPPASCRSPLRNTVNGNLARLATSAQLRCAAHEYRLAAAGHCHLLLYNKLMPWDHAPAGCCIARPAATARISTARPTGRPPQRRLDLRAGRSELARRARGLCSAA